jgi:2-polyprenyl-3-methyl-5-hydroxy-6-metoxy-1,4-benzoquinol methylase
LTNLASRYGRCEGIDPVSEVVKGARRLFPHLRFHHGTARTILECSEFIPYDMILSSEVIEHVPLSEKEHFINDLFGLLKPEGRVILTTPRGDAYDSWKKRTDFVDQPVEEWLKEDELLHLFVEQGFQAIGNDRIYVDLPSMAYVTPSKEDQGVTDNLLALYQVWMFHRA